MARALCVLSFHSCVFKMVLELDQCCMTRRLPACNPAWRFGFIRWGMYVILVSFVYWVWKIYDATDTFDYKFGRVMIKEKNCVVVPLHLKLLKT